MDGKINIVMTTTLKLLTMKTFPILQSNPMTRLSRIMLDECPAVSKEAILELLRMENDLTTIRIWSCELIKLEDKRRLQNFMVENNLYVYLEWFE